MSSYPPAFRVAQAVGLTGSFWLCGNISALSLICLPGLAESKTKEGIPSSTITKQWKAIYDRGHAQNPKIALVTASTFLYLAWAVPSKISSLSGNTTAKLYCTAAALTMSIWPWTVITMIPTNDKLMASAKGEEKIEDTEVDELLSRWTLLNGIRGLWPLLGGLVGFAAVLS